MQHQQSRKGTRLSRSARIYFRGPYLASLYFKASILRIFHKLYGVESGEPSSALGALLDVTKCV